MDRRDQRDPEKLRSTNDKLPMIQTVNSGRRFPKYSSRALMVFVLLAALLLGWVSALRNSKRLLRQQEQRLQYAEAELERARDRIHDQTQGIPADPTRTFWQSGLDGSNLAGLKIISDSNAFQRASFRNCILNDSTLEGGGSSFQLACFDGAKMVRAKLQGGSASFQAATFVKADLTGATLIGGASSFQTATFEDAIIVGGKLSGSFQFVNLSGTQLSGADLSGIASSDLASCYFKVPPTYNDQTRFPEGFDPEAYFWRREP